MSGMHILGLLLPVFAASLQAAPPSPLDALDPTEIPAEDRATGLPGGTVAVLGSSRGRHTREAKCIAASPDGRWVASGGRDGTVRLWHPADLRQLQVLEGHGEDVNSVVFSSDSRTLFSFGWDACLRIWRLNGDRWSAAAVHRLSNGHSSSMLSADGKVLAVGELKEKVLWFHINVYRLDGETPRLVKRVDYDDSNPTELALSADGKILAAGGDSNADGEILVWNIDAAGEEPRWRLESKARTHSLEFSPDGKALLIGGHDGSIVRWLLDGAEPRRVGATAAHRDNVSVLKFAPGGSKLFSGAYDGIVKAWDWRVGDLVKSAELVGHQGWIGGIAFAPDKKTVFTASWDQTVRRWNESGGKYEAFKPTEGHRHPLTALTFAPDGRTLASGSWTEIGAQLYPPNEVKLWRLGGKSPLQGSELKDVAGSVYTLAYSKDGKVLAAGHGRGITCWETATWRKIAALSHVLNDGGEPFHAPAEALAFAPDRLHLASGWGAQHLRVTDLSGGSDRTIGQTARLSYHAVGLAFLPDGRLAAGATHGGHVLLLDPSDNGLKELGKLPDFGTVDSLALSPDGKLLVAASDKGRVRIWDVTKLDQPPHILSGGHTDGLAGALFADEGRVIISGDSDGKLVVWDVTKRSPILTQKMPARIWRLAIAPDGRHLAVGCGSGLGYILRFDWEKLRRESKKQDR